MVFRASESEAPPLTPVRPAEAFRRTRKVRRGAALTRSTSAPLAHEEQAF